MNRETLTKKAERQNDGRADNPAAILETMPKFDEAKAKANVERAHAEIAKTQTKREREHASGTNSAAEQDAAKATEQGTSKTAERDPQRTRGELTSLSLRSERPLQPVEKLTPAEASREYLDLLLDLSANFTSAEGKASAVADYDRNGSLVTNSRGYSGGERRVVGQLYKTITGEDYQKATNRVRSESHAQDSAKGREQVKGDDRYVDREWALGLADNIIAGESDWRAAGEATSLDTEAREQMVLEQAHRKAQTELAKIKKGPFGKLKESFYRTFRRKKYDELQSWAKAQDSPTVAGGVADRANARLQKALETAYSEDYGYGHHELNRDRSEAYKDQKNTEYNDQFFGDAKRQEKINRAIALRRKLEAEKLLTRDSSAVRQEELKRRADQNRQAAAEDFLGYKK